MARRATTSTIEETFLAYPRLGSVTPTAPLESTSTAAGRRFWITRMWYGTEGKERPTNSSRSQATQLVRPSGSTTTGVAVGTTGHCSDTQLPPFAGGAHAVLWDKYGTPHDLGGFGGKPNPAILGIGNIAFAVSNRDHVVGAAVRLGNMNDEAFIWTKETSMMDLDRLEGDTNSAGLCINSKDEVVGVRSTAICSLATRIPSFERKGC